MNDEEIKDYIKSNIEDFHQLLKKHSKKSDFILFATRKGLLDNLSIYMFFDRDRKKVIQDFNKIIKEYKVEKIKKKEIKEEQERLSKKRKEIAKQVIENKKTEEKKQIIQQKQNLDIQDKFSSYRLNLGDSYSSWKKTENWMKFFIELGAYVNQIEKINLYISYLNDEIPTVFLLLGILDNYYSEVSITDKYIKTLFKQKNEIVFYNSTENAWRNTKDYQLEYLNLNKKEELYLRVIYRKPREKPVTKYFPKNTWLDNIRLAGLYKGTPGRNDRIILNDDISDFYLKYYGKDKSNRLKFSNQIIANIIGPGKAGKIYELNSDIEFSNTYDNFRANGIIYQDSRKYNASHFRNVGSINSPSKPYPSSSEIISVFLNSNNALKYEKYRTDKNIYIVNRLKANKNLNDELFINQISKFKSEQKTLKSFYKLLSKKGINLPRGIELYEWK